MLNELHIIQEKLATFPTKLIQTIGSRIFNVNNPKDSDFLAVVDGPHNFTDDDRRKLLSETGIDLFVFSIDYYKNFLTTYTVEDFSPMRILCALGNHECARQNYNVLYGEPPCKEISLFDNKKLALTRILEIGDMNFFSPYIVKINPETKEQVCTKLMCWALWYAYVFENDSLNLSKDQQNTIQLCHDGNLPITESVKLRKKIEDLLAKC